MDDRDDWQLEFARELQVTLIMARYAHDRAGAITEQNIIGDPDGNFLTARRVDCKGAGENTGLFL